ncbi:hypothetical protein HanIR_Chr08g0360581 [Helianthus annuus]|nr:hypothetical protein HanIR_Chr08g0360581 [Helianthus annuus]
MQWMGLGWEALLNRRRVWDPQGNIQKQGVSCGVASAVVASHVDFVFFFFFFFFAYVGPANQSQLCHPPPSPGQAQSQASRATSWPTLAWCGLASIAS